MIPEELEKIRGLLGTVFAEGRYDEASSIVAELVANDNFVEFLTLHDEFHQTGLQSPFAFCVAWRALNGHPQVPVRIKDIAVVIVNEVGNDCQGLHDLDTHIKTPFQHAGLVPRNGLDRGIRDARPLSRERKLL